MTRAILKWTVPVDDRDHHIGSSPVVLVGCQNDNYSVVTVWTDEPDVSQVKIRSARVHGTGQTVEPADEHVGSVITGTLVWHLFASPRPPAKPQAVTA